MLTPQKRTTTIEVNILHCFAHPLLNSLETLHSTRNTLPSRRLVSSGWSAHPDAEMNQPHPIIPWMLRDRPQSNSRYIWNTRLLRLLVKVLLMAYLIMLVGVSKSRITTGKKFWRRMASIFSSFKKNRPMFLTKVFIEASPNIYEQVYLAHDPLVRP